jgi:lipid intermediate transporter
VLFDVYITWARIEQSNASAAADDRQGPWWALSEAPILVQYLFFLTMNVLATMAQHGVIRMLSQVIFTRLNLQKRPTVVQDDDQQVDGTQAGRASPSAISTALLVSSCSKLFPILLVIWPSANSDSATSETTSISGGLGRAFVSNASNSVGWVVLLSNIEALLILLDCGYAIATSLALAGLLCRWTIENWALGLAGLKSSSSREAVSDGLSLINGWFSASA